MVLLLFGIYFHSGENPEPYDQYDFFWMNYYESHEDAEAGYARFQANGSDVQELFDAAASCEGPFGMDTYQFYPDPDDAQSLLTLRKAAYSGFFFIFFN